MSSCVAAIITVATVMIVLWVCVRAFHAEQRVRESFMHLREMNRRMHKP